jgi:hypothetical protein
VKCSEQVFSAGGEDASAPRKQTVFNKKEAVCYYLQNNTIIL